MRRVELGRMHIISRRNTSCITFTVNSSKPNQLWQNCFIKNILLYSTVVIAIILFDYCCFYFPWQILIWRRCCSKTIHFCSAKLLYVTVSVKCVFELMRINYLLLMPFVRFRLSQIRLKTIFVIEDEKSSVCCRRNLD